MLAKKYIINNGNLIMGEVEFHQELTKDHMGTVGGGRYHYYPELYGDAIFFYGWSVDYGKVTREQFFAALEKTPLAGIYANSRVFFSKGEYVSDAHKEEDAAKYIAELVAASKNKSE